MKKLYDLYYLDFLIDENMTEDEFIDDLMEFEVDFSYTPDGNYFVINNDNYFFNVHMEE